MPTEHRRAQWREAQRRRRARHPEMDREYNRSLNGHARWLRYNDRRALARLDSQIKEAGIAL